MLVATAAACSPTRLDTDNGVDDIRAACELRATSWAHGQADECIKCMVGSKLEACDCEEFRDFAGKCRSQEVARLAEPSCTTDVKACAGACAKTDCGCLDGCYAAAEACKRVVAATDGCATQVCTPYCE